MSQNQPLAIIFNPNAGRGKALKVKNKLIKYLSDKQISFHIEYTNGQMHALDITQRLKNNYSFIISAGGDGTANEVANGLIGSKTSLAYIPIGSGNDFNKIIGMPKNIDEMFDVISNSKKRIIDVGRVSLQNKSGLKKNRYFINTLGIGIDASIAKETKRFKHIRGLALYLIATIRTLIFYRTTFFKIKFDDQVLYEDSFLLCVGNGKFEGGGFNMVPDAVPDDGYLNLCLIKKMPIRFALTVIPKIIKGSHGSHEKVLMRKIKSVYLESSTPFIVHIDGEILEEECMKIEISVKEKAISIITNK